MSDLTRDITRLEELLAGLAIGDLAPEEHAELQSLLATRGDQTSGSAADSASVSASPAARDHLAAGALVAALAKSSAPGTVASVSPALRTKLLAQGLALTGASSTGASGTGASSTDASSTGASSSENSPAAPLHARFGWIAAAAALAFAAVGWLRPSGVPVIATSTSTWALRQTLLAENTDTVVLAFNNTADEASKGLSGDVVWNQRLQAGFLRFRGLAKNNPSKDQYQLWIFDGGRPAEYPVDGGVFDAAAVRPDNGDMIIPIDAKLLVRNPAAFAVTIEQSGGVVVTKRERVVALAAKPAPKPDEKPSDAPSGTPGSQPGQSPPPE